MRHNFSLETQIIESNIDTFSKYLRDHSIEAAYISSFDIFMNEYVPLQECHRYYFSGFSGSVAEVLVLASGKSLLFVDGRYHEQADIEIKASNVEVVKCAFGSSLFEELLKKVSELNISSLWMNGDRSSLGSYEALEKIIDAITIQNDEAIFNIVKFQEFSKDATLTCVSNVISAKDKVAKILNDSEAFWISALDSISWITNLRGYGLPFQSSFMARCLVKRDGISLAVPTHYEVNEMEDFISIDKMNLKNFSKDCSLEGIETIFYDPQLINLTDYQQLEKRVGKDQLVAKAMGITKAHAVKTADEIKLMKDAFRAGDKSIIETLRWVRDSFNKGESISEVDIFHKTTHFYEANGSKEQSFGTISGLGANSSIIHYSSPSKDVIAKDSMILLLDSGGYFEAGFATDTTRTIFLGNGEASEKQKLIYTLVLKGMLQAQYAVFPKGTWGSQIDALARSPILRAGFNYAHGTGHGVGINVHEGGLRFSPTSSIGLELGNVGSIEPGIYLPGFGGVRLENIVTVVEHPEHKDLLCFEPLVYIGFDHKLINFDLLEECEKKWLKDYESECEKRGTLYS
ncbi:M24 family metallopeptidase [Halobacteriovorax sp. HLS]|uniref:M24 family metallopeptidase n=1 Tax=Halobacteriovorax sp. HLS TaxID=2234000 RepID=UPI000FDAAF14|nr:M24 family metallopeptidase [Halobacteriovorax sp. HLS]